METATWIGVALAGLTMLNGAWDKWLAFKEKAMGLTQMRVELEECKTDRVELRSEINNIKLQTGVR